MRFGYIPLDGRPHLDLTPLYMEESRGHWESDTLVVDVTNQKARPWIDQATIHTA